MAAVPASVPGLAPRGEAVVWARVIEKSSSQQLAAAKPAENFEDAVLPLLLTSIASVPRPVVWARVIEESSRQKPLAKPSEDIQDAVLDTSCTSAEAVPALDAPEEKAANLLDACAHIHAVGAAKEMAAELQDAGASTEQGDPWTSPPWLLPAKQQERRAELGLDETRVSSFIAASEFVSLGSFCGAAFALQGLGLKRFAYPFDWNRSPVDGVVHCIENDFADFFTYSFSRPEANHVTLYGGSHWGGSFWHHDPDDPKVRHDFRRRVDRLLGRSTEVLNTASRVFVRHANSSSELAATLALHETLRRALPSAEVYLLVLIDLQQGYVPLAINGAEKLLFYQVPESLFADPNVHFAAQMQLSVEAYTQAIAFALKLWSGDLDSLSKTLLVPSLEHLEGLCQPFHGGDPSTMLFVPRRTQT